MGRIDDIMCDDIICEDLHLISMAGIDDITCEDLHLVSIAGMDDTTCDDLTYNILNLDVYEIVVLGLMI